MCKFIGKSNEWILCKQSKSEILRLYSVVHVAMKLQKRQIFPVNQNLSSIYAMSWQMTYTHKLPKLCSATLNRKFRLRVLWKICSGCLLPVLAPHVLGNKQKKALMFPCPFNLVSILYCLVVPLRLYIKMRNRIHTSLKKVVLITNETRNLQKKRFFCKM